MFRSGSARWSSPMRTDVERPLLGPAITGPDREIWTQALSDFAGNGLVALNRGWNLDWERAVWERGGADGREHLSIRVHHDEVVIGPRWVPDTDAGCAGCAEVRGRTLLDHPLVEELASPCAAPG